MNPMSIFPLPVFPVGALDSSVITTVWVGIMIIAFFNLRFGWVLSGLVVPGYIVPLLLIKPWSVAIIGSEALLTYLLVRAYSDWLSRLGYWSSLFGRDRFFALVLISAGVRLAADGYALPVLADWAETRYGWRIDYANYLQSFGLIISSLIANQFWKTGLWRGLPQLLTSVGLTWVIVRYGLVEWTNFSISNLGYMYEDLAASMLASPKAYIILLSVALLASHMNLRYGWDFNGILIPSLLALQWYQPIKILTSFGEAFVILLLGSWLMQTPWLRRINIEGARKLVLFFNVGFAYKLMLGMVLIRFWPDIKVTDMYAFGYVLSTLIAIKIHDKNLPVRLPYATLQTSLVGVAGASVVGFLLTQLPDPHHWLNPARSVEVALERRPADDFWTRLQRDNVQQYHGLAYTQPQLPALAELDHFSAAMRALADYRVSRKEEELRSAAMYLDRVNYRVALSGERYVYLYEAPKGSGRGVYVLDLETDSKLTLSVPAPLREYGTAEAGINLMRILGARALAIAGPRRSDMPSAYIDPYTPNSFFQRFHAALASRNVLQLRATTALSRQTGAEAESVLWIYRGLPEDLEVAHLQRIVPELPIAWGEHSALNRQRNSSWSGFAEWFLNRAALRRAALPALTPGAGQIPLHRTTQRIDGYLREWLSADKQRIAPPHSDVYTPPTAGELLFWDDNILTPLVHLLHNAYRSGGLDAEFDAELGTLNALVDLFGYHFIHYHHVSDQSEYLLLVEQDGAPYRYWGTYVFRLAAPRDYLVQVARPLYEINTFEYGAVLFVDLHARLLAIAGTHPDTNRDGSADIINPRNLPNLFNLVNQVMMRENPAGAGLSTLHVRAFGYKPERPPPQADVLLAPAGGPLAGAPSPLLEHVLATLRGGGLKVRFVEGAAATAGYEAGNLPQALYVEATREQEFAILWLSREARASYREQGDNPLQERDFQTLGIATREAELQRELAAHPANPVWREGIPGEIATALRDYRTYHDIVALRRLQKHLPDFTLTRLVERDTRQAFLVIRDTRGRWVALANLNARAEATLVLAEKPHHAGLDDFLGGAYTWLLPPS